MRSAYKHHYGYNVDGNGVRVTLDPISDLLPFGTFIVSLLDWSPGGPGGNAILVCADSRRDAAEKRFALLNSDLVDRQGSEIRVHVIGNSDLGFSAETFTFSRDWTLVA